MSAAVDLGRNCPFCDIIQGHASAQIIYESEIAISFAPLKPATIGHLLVVPRVHVETIWEAPDAVVVSLAQVTVLVAKAQRVTLALAGLNIIQSNGLAATQTVDHLHVHLVPRYEADRMTLDWPDDSVTSTDASTAIDKLREVLRTSRQ